MAGNGDKGTPNGLPVDEWGIRVNENSQPVGSCVARGGDTNGPAAVYAVEKYVDWLKNYAPPAAAGMVFSEAGPVPAQGEIAQQIFWYTAFTADMVKRSEEHTSELQSLMRISYAVFCLKKKKTPTRVRSVKNKI